MAIFICECGYKETVQNSNIGRKVKCPKCDKFSLVKGGSLPDYQGQNDGPDSPDPDYDAMLCAANSKNVQGSYLGFIWATVIVITLLGSVIFFSYSSNEAEGVSFIAFLLAVYIVASSIDRLSRLNKNNADTDNR